MIPGGQLASIVFAGISATAIGVEISVYSDNPYLDTLIESLKLVLPIKKPYDVFPSYLLDRLRAEIKGILSRKNIQASQEQCT